jgi:HEPN domain-containing protein
MNQAEDWFKLAEEDRRVAEWAFQEGIYTQVCFHAQQGAEKMLKGFLKWHSQSIPKTHSLVEILSHCVALDQTIEEIRGDCRNLQAYYIPTRYPDALPGSLLEGLPIGKDAEEAYNGLIRIMNLIRGRVEKER